MTLADQDWISMTDLARERGVSQQSISKRMKSLARHGAIPKRRDGVRILIHRPSFEALVAQTHDPAQELRNRNVKRHATPTVVDAIDGGFGIAPRPAAPSSPSAFLPHPSPPEPSKFNDAAAREKDAKAALAEMQLAQRRGELVPAAEIGRAALAVATKIFQAVESIVARSGKIYAAGKGGEEAHQIELREAVNETLATIAASMTELEVLDASEV
ncbi:MAG: transcriptional regulator [Hyphomicrobiales bacterium]|nr:MAG: transcriptional regulator [Hyphomicrobiales bacterium]